MVNYHADVAIRSDFFSKTYVCIPHPADRIIHTTAFVTPVVEHYVAPLSYFAFVTPSAEYWLGVVKYRKNKSVIIYIYICL